MFNPEPKLTDSEEAIFELGRIAAESESLRDLARRLAEALNALTNEDRVMDLRADMVDFYHEPALNLLEKHFPEIGQALESARAAGVIE